MKTKDFLLKIQKYDLLIENKTADREYWLSMAKSTTAPAAPETGVRVQSSGAQQKMSAAVDRAVDLDREIKELSEKRQEIITLIEQLEDIEEYDVLYKRYVGTFKNGERHYWDYYEIAESHGKSYSWANGKHGNALKNVQRIINSNKKM